MAEVPKFTVKTDGRKIRLGPVSTNSWHDFVGGHVPMPSQNVHAALAKDLMDSDTTTWAVRVTRERRRKRLDTQTIGIVAISPYARKEATGQPIGHHVWYGEIGDEWRPPFFRGMPAAAFAMAVATGFGFRLHEQLYLLDYRLHGGITLAELTLAEKLGYTLTKNVLVHENGEEIPEMVAKRSQYKDPLNGDYISAALRQMSQGASLEP